MSTSLDPILLNLLYACLGGLLGLLLSWIGSLVFQWRIGFRIRDALKNDNRAMTWCSWAFLSAMASAWA
jgi:hypothetical protein